MKTKTNTNNLQKSSVLFLQLGLVLTLFTVYTAFELKTEQRSAIKIERPIDNEAYQFENLKDFRIEEKIIKKTKTIVQKQKSQEIIVDDTPQKKDAPLFEALDPDTPTKSREIVEVNEPEDFVETVPTFSYTAVQEIPIFPGCEKVKKEKRRACFEKKIYKFVQRKFNTNLAPQLGLSSGKKRIFVEFIINKEGFIEITNASAPHIRLKKEGKRIVNKLPKMIPGKQNGEAVNIKYTLPISFRVE